MSKNDIPPRITLPALPDRLRNDGWWLAQDSERRGAPAAAKQVVMLIETEKRHLREEQQWIYQIP